MSSPEAPLSLRPGQIDFTIVDGEIVGVDLSRSVYFSVNGSGAALWSALRAGTTEAELRTILVDAYGLSADKAEADVGRFLGELRSEGLLSDDGAH